MGLAESSIMRSSIGSSLRRKRERLDQVIIALSVQLVLIAGALVAVNL